MNGRTTITGAAMAGSCIGCEIASGSYAGYAGTIYESDRFHAHQDVEIALPGFIVVSTMRHIASIADFSDAEIEENAKLAVAIRRAQRECGFGNVYLFQNEDTADHFHTWMFPVYPWMLAFEKGPALLRAAIAELKAGRHGHQLEEVFAIAAALKNALEVGLGRHL